MILPIYAYGQPVLKKKAVEIDKDYPNLNHLINNMWETMYHADGVGLAAPQIGKSIRLFLVDTLQLKEKSERKDLVGIKQVFINAEIVREEGKYWTYEEGCLSIPKVHGDVERQESITIHYYDENFEEHNQIFTGMDARVIQHEYDHIDGILFTEKLKPVRRRLVKSKLEKIRKGQINPDYVMRYARK